MSHACQRPTNTPLAGDLWTCPDCQAVWEAVAFYVPQRCGYWQRLFPPHEQLIGMRGVEGVTFEEDQT